MTGASRAPLVLPLPFRRSGYLVRKTPGGWLADIESGLERFDVGSDAEACSAVLNSFSLLLLKLGHIERSRRLCQSQHRRFLGRNDPLAIQPFINIGRIDLRLRRFESAAGHFFLRDRIRTGCRISLGGARVTIDDPALADVCATVRLVDGAHLVFNRDGNVAAQAFLAAAGPPGGSAAHEMRIWFAYHGGDGALLRDEIDRLCRRSDDFAKLAFYAALHHLRAGRGRETFLSMCVLLEALRESADRRDDVASILHALKFLLSQCLPFSASYARIRDQPAVRDAAARLGDVELCAFFQGEDERLCYQVGSGFARRLDLCCGLAERRLAEDCAPSRAVATM